MSSTPIPNLRLSLRQQITAVAILVALFATSTVAILVMLNEKIAQKSVSDEVDSFTVERVTHSAQKTYNVCQVAQDFIQKSLNTNLNVARAALKQVGGIQLSAKPTTWSATNQYTLLKTTITAPTWNLGGQPLQGDRSFEKHIPVVDSVTEETTDTVTLFQRVNEAGDMLRVATSVVASDGKRAIGTFIPAIMPDGSANPVVKTVLGGQTFRGRAYVVNAWYITAYEPLLDAHGNNIGMLYVGVKQEGVDSLRQALTFASKSGDHSSIAVYYGKGSQNFSNRAVIRFRSPSCTGALP